MRSEIGSRANTFQQVGESVDNGVSIQSNSSAIGKLDFPRTDSINTDFVPWIAENLSRCKLADRFVEILVTLTTATCFDIIMNHFFHLGPIQMLVERKIESVATAMAADGMIPR